MAQTGNGRVIGGARVRGADREFLPGLPLVSIILPVWNAAGALEQALLEIHRQTYVNREIIVFDGGSLDGTRDVLKRLDILVDYWESAPDRGIYDAMNRGVDAAQGEWLYFMGVDDRFYGDSLLSDLMAPGAIPNSMDLIVGQVLQAKNRLFRSRFDRRLLLKNTVHHQSVFYHRRLFKRFRYGRAHGCRPYRISGDYQLNLRLLICGSRAHRVDRVIARCAGGVSQEGRLIGYLEEILIRHGEIPFGAALLLDFQTLARYALKQLTRHLRRR